MGNLTSGRVLSANLYPTTMGEKSEMWSTDKLMLVAHPPGVKDPDSYSNVLSYLESCRAQWNPVLCIAVPDPAVFKARISITAAIRARGVRFNRRWLAIFGEIDRKKLPFAPGGLVIFRQDGNKHSTDTVRKLDVVNSDAFAKMWN